MTRQVLALSGGVGGAKLVDGLARVLPPDELAVIINTGWSKLWGKDNARYMKGIPGIGVAAAEWLVKQDPMLIGGDSPPVEVNPNPDPQVSLPIHQIMLVVNGIHLLENLKLDELAAKRIRIVGYTEASGVYHLRVGRGGFV